MKQNSPSCTKPHRRYILKTRTNQKASSSTELYHRAVPWTRMNYVLQRKTNQNALFKNKKTQRMSLNNICRNIITSLMYFNAEEIFWTDLTCHMKERAWPLLEKNTLRICWILYSNIIVIMAHHCPVKRFKNQLVYSSKRKKNILNVTSIKLLQILSFSLPSLSMHRRKMQT